MIKINGKTENDTQNLTITEMLKKFAYVPAHVAVEYNLEMLEKDKFDSTVIKDGDEIEIVTFMGGGK